jgi:dihydroneopterin aldolase
VAEGVLIELHALEVHGFHGATERERREGQPFLFDVDLVLESKGLRTDELRDTVDYRDVVATIRDVGERSTFTLIEALAAAVANALVERFPVSLARVRVRKPDVRLELPVGYTAATVERRGR